MTEFTPDRLRAIRHKFHITQDALAKISDCKQQTINKWEMGQLNMTPAYWAIFCRIEKELDDLFVNVSGGSIDLFFTILNKKYNFMPPAKPFFQVKVNIHRKKREVPNAIPEEEILPDSKPQLN